MQNYDTGIILTDVVGYFATFCINSKSNINSVPKYVYTRQMKPHHTAHFKNTLSLLDFSCVASFGCSNEAYDRFTELYLRYGSHKSFILGLYMDYYAICLVIALISSLNKT